MEHLRSDARLLLAGTFSPKPIAEEVRRYPGWRRVDELGFIDRTGLRDVLSRSIAGLVTLHLTPNHLESLPIKMFEYMSAGIPVIASNFPLWIDIIQGNNCGICLDPLDPRKIAEAIDFLAGNPEQAKEMGENGRRAVENRYNWGNEERKLLQLYVQILK